MTDTPEKDPLGARPVLPVPEGAEAERVREVFSRYLADLRRPAQGTKPNRGTERFASVDSPARPADRAGTPEVAARCYDVALSLLDSGEGVFQDDGDLRGQPPRRRNRPDIDSEAPRFPPNGAAAVRPPARERVRSAIDPSRLESLAENVLLQCAPDGSAMFDVTFHDDVFQELSCRVELMNGEVTAVFHAPDAHTRRLFDAESGRLRVCLEQRGLKVKTLRVESI